MSDDRPPDLDEELLEFIQREDNERRGVVPCPGCHGYGQVISAAAPWVGKLHGAPWVVKCEQCKGAGCVPKAEAEGTK